MTSHSPWPGLSSGHDPSTLLPGIPSAAHGVLDLKVWSL